MVASFTDWDKDPNYLAHFGTKGMKWGQRRFQNPDGSLTSLGKERYGSKGGASARRMTKDLNKLDQEKTTSKYRIDKLSGKIARKDARYAEKIAKANKAGKTEKAAKLQGRKDDLKNSRTARKISGYKDLIQKNAQVTNRILQKAKSEGLTVNSKQTKRIVNKGAFAAKLAVGGAAAGALGYALGKKAIRDTPSRLMGNGNWYTYDRATGKTIRGPFLMKDKDELARNMKTARVLAGAAGGALGGAIASTAKKRTGTKYKVKNKYRNV